jgi:hypothetical protein
MMFMLRRTRTALPAAALAGLLFATPALASSSSAAQRALARCQQTVAREGLSYSNQMQFRLSRCVRTLGDCAAGNSSSCRNSSDACRSTSGDLAYLQDRLVRSIVGSCGDVPMGALMNAGFAPGMASCAPTTMDAFGRCVASNLRRELGDVLEQVLPSACALLTSAAVSIPSELCAGLPQCVPPSTTTTVTEPTTTTSTTTTTTLPPVGSGPLYCGGAQNVACPDGSGCDRRDALCSQSTMPGMCVTMPAVCGAGEPVCGCDGLTYASDCERVKAGIVQAHAGACDAPATTCNFTNPTCPDGQFCDFTPGDCGEGGNGVCRPITGEPCNICSAFVVGPVCGCDFHVYATECDRMAAGVAKMWNGPCQ